MKELLSSRHTAIILLLLIIAGAAALRITLLTNDCLHYDEPVAMTCIDAPLSVYLTFPYHDNTEANGWFYYIFIMKPWHYICKQFFNGSRLALRVSSFIIGMINIWAIYLLGAKIHSKRTGLIAAAFMAISGIHCYYSAYMRFHTFNALMATLSTYFLLQYETNRKAIFAYHISVFIMIASTLTSAFLLPAHWLYLFIGRKKSGLKAKELAVFIAISSIIGLALFLVEKYADPEAILRIAWYPRPEPIVALNLFLSFTGIRQHLAAPGAISAIAVAASLFILGAIFSLHSRKKSPKFMLPLLWTVVPFACLYEASIIVHPCIIPRICLFMLPGFCLTLALGCEALRGKRAGSIILLLIFIAAAPALIKETRHPLKYNWSAMIEKRDLYNDQKDYQPNRPQIHSPIIIKPLNKNSKTVSPISGSPSYNSAKSDGSSAEKP
ncbi:MAG: glycosyltransferase family 39 protein [bacterium]|nr:glycosyltransferase family 39 protein [bacterium]